MVALKNSLRIVDERVNLLNESYWSQSTIIGVTTLQPPYGTQRNVPTIGIQWTTVVTA